MDEWTRTEMNELISGWGGDNGHPRAEEGSVKLLMWKV